jgi:hypothetical protein
VKNQFEAFAFSNSKLCSYTSERSIASLRSLLRRTTEAVVLLRLLQENDFARLVGWLTPEVRTLLQQMSLRRFASTVEGARLAGSLVEALMAHFTRNDRSAVDELAARLQQGAPLFFGGEERTFYRARELLQVRNSSRRVFPSSFSSSFGFFFSSPLSSLLSPFSFLLSPLCFCLRGFVWRDDDPYLYNLSIP